MRQRLFESLKAYSESDNYPFHMPGHKRNPESGSLSEFFQYDITEIDGFDNLHEPESLIRDAQERASKLYHSKETYFLVNGSTAGILSAISAAAVRGDKLIISRNCHKAVYHAAFLNRMELHYVYPQNVQGYEIGGPVIKEDIKEELERILNRDKDDIEGLELKKVCKKIAGVVITSPTYDGIVSDIRGIAQLVHSYGIPLIVDQAHGAHFGMHPDYPENAVDQGADIVIHSVHKTLPAPTQTALLHRNGELIDKEILKRYLRIYQTSSPSYLLIAGIDEAVFLAEKEAGSRLGELLLLRNFLLNEMKKCRYIQICPFTEPGKLVISVKGSVMTGQRLYDILREKYHLQMEMAAGSYVIAILSMMDRREGFERLLKALQEIDALAAAEEDTFDQKTELCESSWWQEDLRPQIDMNLWEAYRMPFEEIAFEEAEGKTAAEFINLYPPGIPLLAPGERVEKNLIKLICDYLLRGYHIQGVHDHKIRVLKNSDITLL